MMIIAGVTVKYDIVSMTMKREFCTSLQKRFGREIVLVDDFFMELNDKQKEIAVKSCISGKRGKIDHIIDLVNLGDITMKDVYNHLIWCMNNFMFSPISMNSRRCREYKDSLIDRIKYCQTLFDEYGVEY